MLSKAKKFLGYLWGAPVTLVGLVYVLPCWGLRWYRWTGVHGDGLTWRVDHERSPSWLKRYWSSWAGHAIGNVVVLNQAPEDSPVTLKHELKHVDQVMRLGVFQPLVYGLSFLAIKLGCPGSNPYYSNPFEIDARRYAGQIIDIEGQLKK